MAKKKMIYSQYEKKYPDHLIIIKEANFYRAYNYSATVVSHLMNYPLGKGHLGKIATAGLDKEGLLTALRNKGYSFLLVEDDEITESHQGINPLDLGKDNQETLDATPGLLEAILDKRSTYALMGTNINSDAADEILSRQRKEISAAVKKGYCTFITCADPGYEREAARYVISLKEKNPDIRLIIVRPSSDFHARRERNKEELKNLYNGADCVKIISEEDEPNADSARPEWVLSHSRMILYTSNRQNRQALKHRLLKSERPDGMDCITIWAFWSEREKRYLFPEEQDLILREKSKQGKFYPENFLRMLMKNQDFKEIPEYPPDVEERLWYILNGISPKTREIILMRFKNKMTLPEIADIYGLASASISDTIRRTVKKIRESRQSMIYILDQYR